MTLSMTSNARFSAKAREPRAIIEVYATCMAMGSDATNNITQNPNVYTILKSFRGNTAIMSDTKINDTARKKRVIK